MCFQLFTDLDADWRVFVSSGAAQRALERWASDPVFDGARDLDEILARTARGADPVDADAVMRALVRRAAHDDVAARTVLQAVVPGLVSVARRVGAARNS